MKTLLRQAPGRLAAVAAVLIALAAGAIILIDSLVTEASTDGATMSLSVNGQTGKVNVANGTVFTVDVSADSIPLTTGYLGVQAWVDFGATGLTGKKNPVATSPDCAGLIADQLDNAEWAGCLTGTLPPLPQSTYKGSVFTFDATCDTDNEHTIRLLALGDPVAKGSGAGWAVNVTTWVPADYTDIGGSLVADSIDVNCGTPPTPTPTPTAPPVETVSTPIGPAGGDLSTDTGEVPDLVEVTLNVPDGALSETETITIDVYNSDELPAPTGDGVFLSRSFVFEPDGLTFSTPATATISYDESEVTGIDESTIDVLAYDSQTDDWEIAEVTARDTVANTITIAMPHFSPRLPCRGDDCDQDGCRNVREEGANEMLGGLRDMLNGSDFYDVGDPDGGLKDGVVELFADALRVIGEFDPVGYDPGEPATYSPGLKVDYDRGSAVGQPNYWNMTAPDGKIELFVDILGVIGQVFHDCR